LIIREFILQRNSISVLNVVSWSTLLRHQRNHWEKPHQYLQEDFFLQPEFSPLNIKEIIITLLERSPIKPIWEIFLTEFMYQNIHMGKKTHKCNKGEKSFSRPSDLQIAPRT
jgi:hypothetical protein